jgi:hypothetical protein
MTAAALTTRLIEDVAVAPTYERRLRSGFVAITAATALIAAWSLIILVTTSVTWGLSGLLLAAVVGVADAALNTPTRLAVTPDGVTLGYWRREKTFAPRDVVLTHDVPRDRLTLARRGKRRSLMQTRDRNAHKAVLAFVAAGVEIISQ